MVYMHVLLVRVSVVLDTPDIPVRVSLPIACSLVSTGERTAVVDRLATHQLVLH